MRGFRGSLGIATLRVLDDLSYLYLPGHFKFLHDQPQERQVSQAPSDQYADVDRGCIRSVLSTLRKLSRW